MTHTETKKNGGIAVYYDHMLYGLDFIKVKNCPIKDSNIRLTVRVTGQPDTCFSIPARTTYKKKNISGFLTSNEDGFYFVPFKKYEGILT
jgi:hypothetical protein